MKKIIKFTLAVMIVFMQLSSPIQVFADVIEEENNLDNKIIDAVEDRNIVEDDNTNKVVHEDNDSEELPEDTYTEKSEKEDEFVDDKIINNDDKVSIEEDVISSDSLKKALFMSPSSADLVKFNVDVTVSDSKIKVNINGDSNDKYIAKLNLTFNQILDNEIKDTKVLDRTLVLDNNTIELDDIGANLNGKYNLKVNFYKLDDTISSEDESSLNSYIEDKDCVYEDIKEDFYENEISTKLHLYTEGNSEISCQDNICEMSKDASNKLVNINYSIIEGDKNTENSYVKYFINSDVKLDSVNLNFNNLLFGTYEIKGILYNSYDEEIADDTLIINYEKFDDNLDIASYFADNQVSNDDKAISMTLLSDEVKNDLFDKFIGNVLSEELSCSLDTDSESGLVISNNCYGKLVDDDNLPLVSEIIQKLNNVGIGAVINNKDGNVANLTDYISTNMSMKATLFGISKDYKIIVKGDIDGSLVEDSDANLIIDYLFDNSKLDKYQLVAADVNNDGNVDMLDVSMMAGAICEKYWFSPYSEEEELDVILERDSNTVINVGDTFKVTFKIKGLKENYINGLDAILDYDSDVLELIDCSIHDILTDYGNDVDNRLVHVGLNIVGVDDTLVTFTFKALNSGNTTVKISNLVLGMDGIKLDITDNVSVDIKIGDNSDNNSSESSSSSPVANFSDNNNSNDSTSNNNSNSSSVNNINTVPIENKITYNNYLAKLEIDGYEIDFDKEVLEYNITVDNDVDSLDITAIAEDSTSSVRIYGNSNFKEGENVVKIVVTAADGSERTYVINVNKKAKDVVKKLDTEDKATTNNNIEKTIIIILIILVVLGLIYLIFKKDNDKE